MWQHAKAVTGLQLVNEHTLVSGSADGRVNLWDLRRPGPPTRTVSPDGRCGGILVWVLGRLNFCPAVPRPSKEPLVPRPGGCGAAGMVGSDCCDVRVSRAVNRIAVSPVGESLVAVTKGGLYSIDLLDASSSVTTITHKPPPPVTSLHWNSATGGVYAGSNNGSIRVYRQLLV